MKTLSIDHKQLIMIGGKGGVGKTTCSSAVALHLARSGLRTLIISSDPAPSLSDIFEAPIGDQEQPIPGVENLYGLEISSEVILRRWKERFGPEIYEVLSAFANLDYDFVDYIGGAPGIEEEFMLNYIMELVESQRYDRVVWDTAPAGHTLRLLYLPQLFIRHLEAAVKFYLNLYGALEKIARTVRLRKSRRSTLKIIEGWKTLSEKVLRFIRNEERTEFLIVTIAEALGVKLTERVLKEFDEFHLPVRHLIINYLVQEADCAFHRQRRAMQRKYVHLLKELYGKRMTFTEVPLLPYEVKGIRRIEQIAEFLWRPERKIP